jgi:tetratricopeptide (TPR) repeat protein
VGHHHHAAAVENNHGYLLSGLNRFVEAETRLTRARKLFDGFSDTVRRAQVDETLAQLYIGSERFDAALEAIARAVDALEVGGEEALLAEALTTQGRVLSELQRPVEARRVLDSAYRVAERCGDTEGAAAQFSLSLKNSSSK